MHELAITEGIMELAVPTALEHGAKRIIEIRLKIGALSGVVPECIQYYFDSVSKGTIAEGAKLVSEVIPVTIKCHDCGFDGPVKRGMIRCPSCQGTNYKVTGGSEYFVDNLEVE